MVAKSSTFHDLFVGAQIGWRDGRPLWSTRAQLRYTSSSLGATIFIPVDFITDGASVPRVPMAYLLAGGKGNRSAVIHDFAYQFGYWLLDDALVRVDKKTADDVFYESLLADPMSGASSMDARLMWMFVRGFGRGVWANEQRALELNPIWYATGVETA